MRDKEKERGLMTLFKMNRKIVRKALIGFLILGNQYS